MKQARDRGFRVWLSRFKQEIHVNLQSMSDLLNRVDGHRKSRALDFADIGTAEASLSRQVFLTQANALATINDVLCHALLEIHLVALPDRQPSEPRDICDIR